MGNIGILNVGAGDTKLTFDKTNPVEVIRSGRIVRDMLRRGYALLVEVDDGKGGKIYARAQDFDEQTSEYIIADGPDHALDAPQSNLPASRSAPREEVAIDTPQETEAPTLKRRGRPAGIKRVPADSTTGVAVARSAGG